MRKNPANHSVLAGNVVIISEGNASPARAGAGRRAQRDQRLGFIAAFAIGPFVLMIDC
jgi:hypothetical protein